MERFLGYYASLPSYTKAAEVVGLARQPNGKRHQHQRTRPQRALEEVHKQLLVMERDLRACSDFAGLFRIVKAHIDTIHQIAELATYDTALRIGAYFGLEPEKVYLHSGAREGAENIGINRRGRRAVAVR
jgi:plasmid maintenance system antidote protein VapI